jgi:hypothetical protein
MKWLEKFGWENLDHPIFGPHLAPSDLYLFPKINEFLGSKWMQLMKK